MQQKCGNCLRRNNFTKTLVYVLFWGLTLAYRCGNAADDSESPSGADSVAADPETDHVLTWKELISTSRRIAVVDVPPSGAAYDNPAQVPCAVKRDLLRESGRNLSEESVLFLDMREFKPAPGAHLVFLRKKTQTKPESWQVEALQSVYSETLADIVESSLKKPDAISETRYLTDADRRRAAEIRYRHAPVVMVKKTDGKITTEAVLSLSISAVRDKFHRTGHAMLYLTLKNTGASPVAVYTGIGAIWALEIKGGGLGRTLRIRPGYDETLIRSGFNPAEIAGVKDFSIIPAGGKYVQKIYLTPDEFPVLDTLTAPVTIRAGFKTAVDRLAQQVDISVRKSFPPIWKGTVLSAPIHLALQIDKQQEFLDRMQRGDPEAIREFQKMQREGIPEIDSTTGKQQGAQSEIPAK